MWRRGTQAAARNRNPRADSGSRSPHLLSSIMRSAGDSERATSASDMGRTRTTTLMLSADCEEAAGPCCEPEDAEKVEKAPEEVGARGRGGGGPTRDRLAMEGAIGDWGSERDDTGR